MPVIYRVRLQKNVHNVKYNFPEIIDISLQNY